MYIRLVPIPAKESFFLFGPRLTGKSTILKQVFSGKALFIDFLAQDQFEKYATDPLALEREIKATGVQRVVLDEIQRIPALLNEVHRLMESGTCSGIQFIMSGSSARKLKRGQANLLAGRAWLRYLHPLTHVELGERFELERALNRGTLPKIYDASDGEAKEYLRAYVETYLDEEIRAEALVRRLGAFLKFLSLAAHEAGGIINFSNLGREIGIGYKAVQEYFQILEDTLIGFWLPSYSGSARTRLARHPKFYFFDAGVLRAVAKMLAVPAAPGTPWHGRLFELWFINEIRRLDSYKQLDFNFSFYRTEGGAEVDLIIEQGGKALAAVEIKDTPRPASSHCRGLLSFSANRPEAQLFLVCLAAQPQLFEFEGKQVWALPWAEALKRIQELRSAAL